MKLDNRTKKVLKVFCLVLCLAVLTGCTANLKNGELIASRAIDLSTPWPKITNWFDFFFVFPLSKGMLYVQKLTGCNIAVCVVVMTIIVNLITLPLMIKSTVSTQKMQLLQPELTKIQNKYKGRNDQASTTRMNAEIQALYKKNNVSMWSSFITFLTLPIMLAMYHAVQRLSIVYETTIFGINMGVTPMNHVFKLEIGYIILVILVAASQFFSIKINDIMVKKQRTKYENQQAQAMNMNTMNNVMTVMIIYFALILPSAMSLYWITTSCINILRTIYIHKFHMDELKQEHDAINVNYLNKKSSKKKK